MPESKLIKIDDDNDEVTSTRHKESNSSQKLSKNKRSRLTFPFGACRVCSDSATGIHYGIATCEGCKGFFKRSILRKEKYRCYFDSLCIINVANRNRCKACRFRKCINQGMSVDGVKMGRIPKLVKERALQELQDKKLKETNSSETNDEQTKESLCSSSSDRCTENEDSNTMETDSIEAQVPSVRLQDDSTNPCANYESDNKSGRKHSVNNHQQEIKHSTHSSTVPSNSNSSTHMTFNHQDQHNNRLKYRTKYPSFLPNDFTVDETDGLYQLATGLLNNQELYYSKTIASKLDQNLLNLSANRFSDEEMRFIRYLRSISYDIFLRRSKRLKQLVSRMNQMIENNIREYPGYDATTSEYFHSIGLCCQVYTHATVLYAEEVPGMRNISVKSRQRLLTRRAFDWYLILYHQLYNDNGECYLLAPNGFQCTRYWMRYLHSDQLADMLFEFCRLFRELHLNEQEFSILLSYYICYDDSTMEDQEIPRMLKSCYFYALYSELCYNRGETKGKVILGRIMQVLELLIPITEQYEKEVASRLLEV